GKALAAADNAAGVLSVKVLRTDTGAGDDGAVRALDLKGLPLGEARYAFKSGERETEAQFDLPVEIRNDIARVDIVGERSAGAVQLLDKRWRRRTVGIVSGSTADTAQPLLASNYYLTRALGPFADVRLGERGSPSEAVAKFAEQRVPMMILADVGTIAPEERADLAGWAEAGGVLVRCAGPRLAAADDELVPVKLRRGGRILGGSLSWEKPQPLAGFGRESPFAGMQVPNDVTVTRQVLAEPDVGLVERTWATLADGTPLVTGARRGKGMVVLFHVTADTRWSDLPISGTFVDMLRRIVGLAGTMSDAETTTAPQGAREALPPSRVLDGFGAFEAPPATARPVPAGSARLHGPRQGRQSTRLLRSARRPARRQPARAGGPHRAGRRRAPQCACRGFPAERATGPARPDLCDRPRDAADRRHRGVLARWRRPPADSAASDGRRACARGRTCRHRGDRRHLAGARRPGERPVRHEGNARDAARLCDHRRRRRGQREQGRTRRAHALSRTADRARGGRADRPRSRARRTRVLPADLLADHAQCAQTECAGAGPHRRLHEAGRHRPVR